MRLVLCTCPTEKADEIAEKILNEKLVACINMIEKIKSKYWWDGKIQTDLETLLIMKTKFENVEKIKDFIPTIHPYEVPEIVFLEISDVNTPYLEWVNSSIK